MENNSHSTGMPQLFIMTLPFVISSGGKESKTIMNYSTVPYIVPFSFRRFVCH
jgi:hypothetical protein